MQQNETPISLRDCIIFTREQASKFLNVSISTIDKLRKSGDLKACHVTTKQSTIRPKPMFHRDELERFARSIPTD